MRHERKIYFTCDVCGAGPLNSPDVTEVKFTAFAYEQYFHACRHCLDGEKRKTVFKKILSFFKKDKK